MKSEVVGILITIFNPESISNIQIIIKGSMSQHDLDDTRVLKILHVDDVSFEQEMMKYLLESVLPFKYQLFFADNGEEAIRKIIEEKYDIVFLDNKLPKKTGLEVLKELKLKKVETNVIFLTGTGDEEIAVAAIKLGARDYISKNNLNATRILKSINEIYLESCFPEEISSEMISIISEFFVNFKSIIPEIRNQVYSQSKREMTSEIIESLDILSEQGFLKMEPLFSVFTCPECETLWNNLFISCPQCSNKILTKGNVIEHLKCGHTDFKEKFLKANKDLTCPKCNEKLVQIGVDYIKVGSHYRCKNNHLFTDPSYIYYCKICKKKYDQDDLILKNVNKYTLTKKGKLRFKFTNQEKNEDPSQLNLIVSDAV
ncbi:MAG: TackOD1 domain-containing metal-binding protein [Promethearchaeota archaeon]|jgi:CheY-like chemotaxis protein